MRDKEREVIYTTKYSVGSARGSHIHVLAVKIAIMSIKCTWITQLFSNDVMFWGGISSID